MMGPIFTSLELRLHLFDFGFFTYIDLHFVFLRQCNECLPCEVHR
jgi:hypothetical protein